MGNFAISAPHDAALRVMVLNRKGGSGKSTIATNLAAYYAATGRRTLLIDHDLHGAATRWLSLRTPNLPKIAGIASQSISNQMTRVWQTRIPAETQRVVIDTPAAVKGQEIVELLTQADVVLIPVLPSDGDIHGVARFIEDLLVGARLRTYPLRVGLIGNRVRENTLVFRSLEKFLSRLELPLLACLRDTQNYIRAAESGSGIHELKPASRARRDLVQWIPLIHWIEGGERLAATPFREAAFSDRALAS
jgi:chromosome partitioning protein